MPWIRKAGAWLPAFAVFGLGGCPAPAPLTLETIFLRPTAEMTATPADLGFSYQDVRIEIEPGREIAIWHVPASESPPRATVVILPGSDRNKSRYLPGLPVFVPRGYDVILVDYEGFGESTPAPLELKRLTDSGFAVVDYALTLETPVVLFGVSTGAPTALRVAAEREAVAAVLLEAPLILELEARLWLEEFIAPSGPLGALLTPTLIGIAEAWMTPQVTDDFKALQYAAAVQKPALVLHSTEDDVVPFPAGVMVYETLAGPAEFFEMRGGHGKMIEIDPELYQSTIHEWLDRTLP